MALTELMNIWIDGLTELMNRWIDYSWIDELVALTELMNRWIGGFNRIDE